MNLSENCLNRNFLNFQMEMVDVRLSIKGLGIFANKTG